MDWKPTQSLSAGMTLYHGTGAKEKFDIPDGPAFFGDTFAVASFFATWRKGPAPRILRYEVATKIPRLAVILSKEDLGRLAEELGEDENTGAFELAERVCVSGLDGWIVPNNYPDGSDIMICEPARWLRRTTEYTIKGRKP